MVVEPPEEPVPPPQRPRSLPPDVLWPHGPRERLPFLKDITLTMLQPRQFGLERWTRTFVIPNNWMRKIYKADAYYDTDLPEKKPEVFSPKQMKLLYDWLINESPFRPNLSKRLKSGRGLRNTCPSTDLIKILDQARDHDMDSDSPADIDSDESDEYRENRIPLLIGHRYQPEDMLVRKAIQNLSRPTEEQTERIKLIMGNPELLEDLHKQVSEHLGLSSTGYSI